MSAWLKEIDLDTFRVSVSPLVTTREFPRGARLTVAVPQIARPFACLAGLLSRGRALDLVVAPIA